MVCMNVKLERILILHFHRWKIHCVQSVRTASLPIVNNNKIQIILPPPSACTHYSRNVNLCISGFSGPRSTCSSSEPTTPFPSARTHYSRNVNLSLSYSLNVSFFTDWPTHRLRMSHFRYPIECCASLGPADLGALVHPLNQPYSNHAISDLCWRTVGSQKQSTLLHQMISSKCPKSMFSERLFQHLMHLFFIFFLYFINLKN